MADDGETLATLAARVAALEESREAADDVIRDLVVRLKQREAANSQHRLRFESLLKIVKNLVDDYFVELAQNGEDESKSLTRFRFRFLRLVRNVRRNRQIQRSASGSLTKKQG